MNYVVDVDGTICNNIDGNYEKSVPIPHRINKINKLYDEGHQIIYFTARGMGRYNDDVALAKARFYEITEIQLKLWGCKYHKLVLGKPSGDYYIDDKGIAADEFFRN